jgi:ParB family chromosome partitioning protein
MEPKKVLGRGLATLFPDINITAVNGKSNFFQCKIEEISLNPNQARTIFNEDRLQNLADSIKHRGIIEPLIVRKKEPGYELIAGERRFRAAKMAHLTEVPVLVRELNELDSLVLSLIENLQREDLNPIDEANGYQLLIKKFTLK